MRALGILTAILAISLAYGSVLAQPSDSWLFPLHMFDAQTGWAESRKGSSGIFAKGAIGSLLRTTDGGLRWRDVTPRDPPERQIDPLYVLYPLTSLVAWASAAPMIQHDPALLFRTTDGGQTWKFATMPGSGIVPSVHFINTLDGWRVTYDGDIYRSRDGGNTWVKIGTAKFFRQTAGITFLNTTTGWIAGHKDPPDSVYYLETHDGGRTWQQRNLPLPHQLTLLPTFKSFATGKLPKFFTAKDGIVSVTYSRTGEDAGVVFYITHDGGITWTATTPIASQRDCCAFSFADAEHGWVKSGNALYTTSDSGRRWAKVPSNLPYADVGTLFFVSQGVGWATGQVLSPPLLLKTVDGGRTWAPVPYAIMR